MKMNLIFVRNSLNPPQDLKENIVQVDPKSELPE